ncbi:hypothetical protein [Acidocella sp.]|uniref:hypothetical protein n=1 Tax=Acidocella sp. TaxID=50710 RepID=UPI0026016587|nr:hypothetical protein [Acidocella sp.]
MLVSQAQFAREMGVSRKTVTIWKSEGKIVMDGDLVDLAASRLELEKFSSPRAEARRGGKTGNTQGNAGAQDPALMVVTESVAPSDEDDLKAAASAALQTQGLFKSKAQAELARDSWIAHLRRLQFEREAGKVVEVEHVAGIVGQHLARVRTRLMAIPAERSPDLFRAKTVQALQDQLLEVITEALQELVTDAMQQLAEPPGPDAGD